MHWTSLRGLLEFLGFCVNRHFSIWRYGVGDIIPRPLHFLYIFTDNVIQFTSPHIDISKQKWVSIMHSL